LALAALVLPAVASASPAAAHARLVSTDPEDGSHLNAPPDRVSLRFDEPVDPHATIQVRTDDGTNVGRGATTVDGATVSRDISGPRDGGYTVTYRVVSDDGHPVVGTLTFSTGSVTSVSGPGGSSGTSRALAVAAGLAVVLGIGVLTIRRWAPDLWRTS
jgi:methionine-rich copper-binding protein CopC